MWVFLACLFLVVARQDHEDGVLQQEGQALPPQYMPPCVLSEGVLAASDCKFGQHLAFNLLPVHDPQEALWHVVAMRKYIYPDRLDVIRNWHRTTTDPTFLNLIRPKGVRLHDFVQSRIFYAYVPPLVHLPLADDVVWPKDPDQAIVRVGGFVWVYVHEKSIDPPILIEMRALVPPETRYASAMVMKKMVADPKMDTCDKWHPAIMPFFKGLSRCWQHNEGAAGCFVYGYEVTVTVGDMQSPPAFQPQFRLCIGSPCE